MPISIIAFKEFNSIETLMDTNDLFPMVKKMVEGGGLTWNERAKLMKDGWKFEVVKT